MTNGSVKNIYDKPKTWCAHLEGINLFTYLDDCLILTGPLVSVRNSGG